MEWGSDGTERNERDGGFTVLIRSPQMKPTTPSLAPETTATNTTKKKKKAVCAQHGGEESPRDLAL